MSTHYFNKKLCYSKNCTYKNRPMPAVDFIKYLDKQLYQCEISWWFTTLSSGMSGHMACSSDELFPKPTLSLSKRFNTKVLRAITADPWFVRNNNIYNDLDLPIVSETTVRAT